MNSEAASIGRALERLLTHGDEVLGGGQPGGAAEASAQHSQWASSLEGVSYSLTDSGCAQQRPLLKESSGPRHKGGGFGRILLDS